MLIEADLEGIIDNLSDFKSEALTPIFEAITNSIQAIEEHKTQERGEIVVRIIREIPQTKLSNEEPRDEPKIKSFEIEDNGIGFDEKNYNSFKISASTYKKKMGGKGIGRFSWLKAFERVDVESVYLDNGTKKIRKFEFTKDKGAVPRKNDTISNATQQITKIRMVGFKEVYRKQPSAYKTAKKIAQRVLEHYLPYYIGGKPPSIKITDDKETFSLDELYNNNIKSNIKEEKIVVGRKQFTIHHVKIYQTHNDMHKIVFCANNQDVKLSKLQPILGTPALSDGGKKFYYAAYVSGEYLNNHVDSGRTSFNIPENNNSGYFLDDDDISMDRIKDEVIEATKIYLSDYIKTLNDLKHTMVSDYVSKNPSLRAVPIYCPEIYDVLETDSPIEKINDVLYQHKGKAELEIQKNTEKLLSKTQIMSFQEIEDECKELSNKISAFQKDDLIQYILKRKKIIDLLYKKLELIKNDNKYQLESVIHDILFPRSTSSDQILYEEYPLQIKW